MQVSLVLFRMDNSGSKNSKLIMTQSSYIFPGNLRTVVGILLVAWIMIWWVVVDRTPTMDLPSHYKVSGSRRTNAHQQVGKQTKTQGKRLRNLRRVCGLLRKGFYNHTEYYLENKTFGLLTDHYHRMTFCYIRKVASTSWNRLLSTIVKKEKEERSTWLENRSGQWSVLLKRWARLNNSGFNNVARSNNSNNLKNYFKFLMVRHPLQRLASAYMDRIVNVKKSNQTFETFLRGASRFAHTNPHWSPFINTCHPCSIHYDYIAHLETVQEDLPIILTRLNITDIAHIFSHSGRGSTKSLMYKGMYTNISKSVLQNIFIKFQPDADMFGYSFDGYGSL